MKTKEKTTSLNVKGAKFARLRICFLVFQLRVGKKLLSFGFLSVGFMCWQKPNVQFVRLAFFSLAGNVFVYGWLRWRELS